MTWQNYLGSALDRLWAEALLLVLSLLWVPLRLLQVVGRRVEKGKPVIIKVLGKTLVDISGVEGHHTLRVKGRIPHEEELDIQKKDNHMSLELTEKHASSKKVQHTHHTKEKEVNINGSRSR